MCHWFSVIYIVAIVDKFLQLCALYKFLYHGIVRIVTVSPTDTVLVATKKMLECRMSSAVVIVENKPRGILT